MAAYEVLLLNTSIPQIQAAQAGDTYVVPRDIAFSANTTFSANTANGILYLNASKVASTSSGLTFDGTTATINTLNLTNALGAIYGGTGLTSYTTGDLIYSSATNTLSKLAIGLNTYILTSNGAAPVWAAPSSVVIGTATNLAGGAAGSVPYQSGAGATTFLSIGTANQVVTSTGSAPQWSSGLSITTLTASDAVTFSATTQNIALGTSQTSGTFTVGGTAQTGNIAIDRSTKTHTLNIGTGITESGQTKTINIGTAGDTGSTTAITIGSTNGTTVTVNGTVNATTVNVTTLDLTNLEVTNIKAKDGTAAMSIADSTGVVSITANPVLSGGTANGVLYLNGSKVATSGSALTFDGATLITGSATNTSRGGGFSSALFYRSSGTQYIDIQTGASGIGGLLFSTASTGNYGAVQYDNSGGSLQFFTVSSERMRLNGSSLNIGGNFTSTNNTLQVTGNAAIGYTTAAPTTGLIVAGNVGIGTDSPAEKLDVRSSSNAIGNFQSSSASGYAGINANNGSRNWYAGIRADASNGFGIRDETVGTIRLLIDSSGNLGLGTGTSSLYAKLTSKGTGGAATTTYKGIFNAYNADVDVGLSIGGYNSSPYAMYIQALDPRNGFSTTYPLSLNPDGGNVGIGTTNPAAKLDVQGSQNGISNPANGTINVVDTAAAALGVGGQIVFRGNYVTTTSTQYAAITAYKESATVDGSQYGASLIFNTRTQGGNNTEKMRLDSSGNLGLGVTPSAWSTVLPVLQASNASFTGYNNQALLSSNYYYNAGNKYIANGYASQYSQSSGQHIWYTAANNTSGAGATISFTQAMTLDASGNLLLGLTSGTAKFDMAAGSGSQTAIRVRSLSTNSNGFNIVTDSVTDNVYLNNYYNAAMLFGTNNTERARITSGGYFKASNDGTYFGSTGTYHELRNTGNSEILYGTNTNANPFGVTLNYTAAAPNGTGNSFLQCVDNVATRAVIRSNGGLANYQANDVNLSDQRTKKDIVAAPSYWDKIKGIEIVHFKYKDQTHDDNNVGVIAQQVEQVAPEFVDQDGWGETPEDGVPLKSIYTSDMYHAAIKVLQEAMARIEKLEAEMAALKGA